MLGPGVSTNIQQVPGKVAEERLGVGWEWDGSLVASSKGLLSA
jgi:hypothetical protein